ncbi:helix-turn-helix transcriptional regulator [Streptomyces ipomoeae]|uniref:helix-turn-helix transcriptional regulator n=1 Tax=Streptomyces ipomoeae TaxID=103232 RepID=UPI0011468FBF|nr:AAA family ATPase [Streptomyces ipomoeae]MDX2939102.1 AAA family ATPase [Streptomyces ipomoeae]TQE30892.1 helix-turn-helix transcriptional regulator [Streptomyces ipomoeae]
MNRPGTLLAGRERERRLLLRLLRAQRGPDPSAAVVLVEARPGLGRSTLLRWAAGTAEMLGTQVFTARCSRRESGFRYGMLTQLLAPLPGLENTLSALLRSSGDPFPREALHRLSGHLLSNAADRPLLIVVDDVQWADTPSRQWLSRLVRLLGDAPVTVLLSGTPAAHPESPLSFLDPHLLAGSHRGDGRDHLLRLDPLDPSAVAEMLAAYGPPGPADPETAQALTTACRGNPTVLAAVLESWWEDSRDPEGRTVPGPMEPRALWTLAAQARARLTVAVAAGLTKEAQALLRACAVSSGDLDLEQVCRLAGLGLPAGSRVLRLLRDLDLITADDPPVLVSPEATEQLLTGLTPPDRENLYARAAELCYHAGSEDARVAGLLLAAPSFHAPWVAEVLLRASAGQRLSGASRPFVPGLENALGHTFDPREKARLHIELALVKAVSAPVTCQRHLEMAFELCGTGPESADLRLRIADLLTVLQGLELPFSARTVRNHPGGLTPRERPSWCELWWPDDDGYDPLPGPARAGLLSRHFATAGADPERARALAFEALRRDPGAGGPPLYTPRLGALTTLLLTGDYAEVASAAAVLAEEALYFGATTAAVHALMLRVGAYRRLGRLDEATAVLETAVRLSWSGPRHPRLVPLFAAMHAALLVSYGDLAGAERALAIDLPSVPEDSMAMAVFLFARAEILAATGRPEEALTDLLGCHAGLVACGLANSVLLPWRGRAIALAEQLGNAPLAAQLSAEGSEPAPVRGAPVPGRDLPVPLSDRGPTVSDGLLVADPLTGARPAAAPAGPTARLTPAEQRAAELAALGLSNRLVAERLSISRGTVELHLTRVYRKLGISGRAELSEAIAPGRPKNERDDCAA